MTTRLVGRGGWYPTPGGARFKIRSFHLEAVPVSETVRVVPWLPLAMACRDACVLSKKDATEWETSGEPARMLDYLQGHRDHRDGGRKLSDRKLRLFAVAIARLARVPEKAEGFAFAETWADTCKRPPAQPMPHWDFLNPDAADAARRVCPASWGSSYHHGLIEAVQAKKAAILRDLVGNPFRPLPLWCYDGGRPGLGPIGDTRIDWATPDVLMLAQAAYEERGRKCPTCKGTGNRWTAETFSSVVKGGCQTCHGTGRIDDGTLDPFRFALIADALEEAGCDCETLLLHLRGIEDVPAASGGVTQAVVRVPLRGPHYRGCWALDLILGRS